LFEPLEGTRGNVVIIPRILTWSLTEVSIQFHAPAATLGNDFAIVDE